MKKIAITILVSLLITPVMVSKATAASTKYKTCSALVKKYPRGIAISRSKAKKSRAFISAAIYRANKKLDTDADGIACEKGQPKNQIIPTTSTSPSVPATPSVTYPFPAVTVPETSTTTTTPATTTTTTIPGSFASGTKQVGATGVAPGRYITTTATSCYWERLRGFSGTLGDIIENENTSGSHVIVEIKNTDVGFSSSRCGTWRPYSPVPPTSLVDGVWSIGDEVSPGTWIATFSTSCYWARLSGFSGSLDEIIANDNATSTAIVQIQSSDAGFISKRCGTWTKIG